MAFPAAAPAVAVAEAGRVCERKTGMELATRQFVRPEAHNHHETVYAGRLADWLTEAAMIGVTKILHKNDHVVLAALKEIQIIKPMRAGGILEFFYEVSQLGTTSIDIFVVVKDMLSGETYASGNAVFVTVDEEGRKVPHKLKK